MINQFLPLTDTEKEEMLKTLSISSIDDLFSNMGIEEGYEMDLPPALSEFEVKKYLMDLSSSNISDLTCFAGGGVYDHLIPSTIDHLTGRSEFYTAYTPYQAELSQGTLQSIYEYQTLISRLMGMDVTNASMYDGASSLAEAVLLSLRVQSRKKKTRILISEGVNPIWIEVVKTYTSGIETKLDLVSIDDDGKTSLKDLKEELREDVASVVIQNPNFLGILEEDLMEISDTVHDMDSLLIIASNPISLGILNPPGEYDADISVAEGQPLGIPMSFGGPYLGIMSCKERYLRKMPGRLSGATVDDDGNRGFVMTLQTREQHIRREKATSNICSNQALMALVATIYLSTLGPEGLRDVAYQCIAKTDYLINELKGLEGYILPYPGRVFNEFVLQTPASSYELLSKGLERGIIPGIPLNRLMPLDDDLLLVAVTEKRTREELDKLIEFFKEHG